MFCRLPLRATARRARRAAANINLPDVNWAVSPRALSCGRTVAKRWSSRAYVACLPGYSNECSAALASTSLSTTRLQHCSHHQRHGWPQGCHPLRRRRTSKPSSFSSSSSHPYPPCSSCGCFVYGFQQLLQYRSQRGRCHWPPLEMCRKPPP